MSLGSPPKTPALKEAAKGTQIYEPAIPLWGSFKTLNHFYASRKAKFCRGILRQRKKQPARVTALMVVPFTGVDSNKKHSI